MVLSDKSGHKPQILVVLTKGPDFDAVAADIEEVRTPAPPLLPLPLTAMQNAPKAEEAPAAAAEEAE